MLIFNPEKKIKKNKVNKIKYQNFLIVNINFKKINKINNFWKICF